ncbi:uncharacterized protein K02A2.6-like [Anopheles stephensi]|uniref:uncharacterized protein K02A2.6-like n=1 Tax=Anopheles stephensi TaxID=30069 RepID=UPI00165884E8|nr:uncharacterized protein K02A2.6-like [Anopheles stephensi]
MNTEEEEQQPTRCNCEQRTLAARLLLQQIERLFQLPGCEQVNRTMVPAVTANPAPRNYYTQESILPYLSKIKQFRHDMDEPVPFAEYHAKYRTLLEGNATLKNRVLQQRGVLEYEKYLSSRSQIPFAEWYAEYKQLFECEAQQLSNSAKVDLLMKKLGPVELKKYQSFILPRKPHDIDFATTVNNLKILFRSGQTKLNKWTECLELAKAPAEDLTTFVERVNKTTKKAELSPLSGEQFKCLMFVRGLKCKGDERLRTRLMAMMEEREDVTLAQLTEECGKLMDIQSTSAVIRGQQRNGSQASGQRHDIKRMRHDN